MPQFLLLLHADPTEWLKMPDEGKQAAFGRYKAWADRAREGGYLVGGNKLTSPKLGTPSSERCRPGNRDGVDENIE